MIPRKSLKLAKGVRDWHGKQAALRNRVRETLRSIFERYGYSPLETPAIEREDLLALKGGGEIQKEIFRLSDQGERKLALRFDHTLPLARFVAMEAELKIPFKRYSIGEVFRDGPTQPDQGRYRIFTQCDIDVIGVPGMPAEAELLQLAWDAFLALGLGDVRVRVNNRRVLNGILHAVGAKDEYRTAVILVLDKLDKIGREAVKDELMKIEGAALTAHLVEALLSHTGIEGTNEFKIERLGGIIESEEGRRGLDEVRSLIALCVDLGLEAVEFDPSLARGLDYYTGTTFEVFMRTPEAVSSAICAGGRYDSMIGDIKGSKEPIPAAGISFGLERVCMACEKSFEGLRDSTAEIFLIPLGTLPWCMRLARDLRREGVCVDVELSGRSIKSAMRYVGGLGIPLVVIVGEDELSKGAVNIKRLKDGVQAEVAVSDIAAYVREHTS